MKKFSFRLESVLKVRNLRKKVAERQVSLTQQRLNSLQQEIEHNEAAQVDAFQLFHVGGSQRAFWCEYAQAYQKKLAKEGSELAREQDRLLNKLEGEKRALTRRMKAELVISKLKDHQNQEHQTQVEAAFQAEVEEMDLLRRGREEDW